MNVLKAANEVKKTNKSHVLLDVLVIASIFLVVGGFAYMILNPGKMKSDVRNSERSEEISSIMERMTNYVQTTGNIPAVIPLNRECASIGNEICRIETSDCNGYVDLSGVLIGEEKELPVDPLRKEGNGSGYYISNDGQGNILVCAPLSERNVNIELKQFMY